MNKKYYKSLAEYNGNSDDKKPEKAKDSLSDFFDDPAIQAPSSRRDFLKIFGFGIASAAIAASCKQPVRKAIPYLIKPETVTPGNANYYASTFFDGSDYCSIMVKVRDGRPVKIEGNKLSSVTRGGTNARTQASVLSLYDTARYRNPMVNGQLSGWDETDSQVMDRLSKLSQQGKTIILMTSTIISPSTRSAFRVRSI